MRLKAAAESESHEGRVVACIPGARGSAATKKLSVQAGVATSVTGHHRGVEVGDPLPNQLVEPANAMEVGLRLPCWRKLGGRRRRIPRANLLLEDGVLAAIGVRRAGLRGVFPLSDR